MDAFATIFVLLTFVIGSSLCCLALWTISKSTALRESNVCPAGSEFYADIKCLRTSHCYPWPQSTAFIYIVFPVLQQKWRKITPTILVLCAIIIVLHTVTMTFLDSNLHWVYDRVTHLWHMTDTEWTEFYVRYFELLWSSCEIILILVLDSVIFSFILCRKFKPILISCVQLHPNAARINRRVESRLILQSICQCIPTTTVNIIFFFVLPVTTLPHLQIVFSSIWIVTNLIDASAPAQIMHRFVIIAFHFPQALAANRKRKLKLVTARGQRELSDSNT
ncbi:hypothetical protein PRIPAC_98007 [Pristionchus pacificus]|uniref:G protein-coupled receptor n=1 Tax=Pristionchus pacificus TaxID=54126 RepID=A0A2A6D1D9_PRIPA|nr:hypothetical protein PRIPAC_98007 [Pristionchus pacificus]|eukprot:PDM84199.1 G protein-coupled receptor [Pristionchus pacificus]